MDAVGVSDFHKDQERCTLDWEVPTITIVAQEQIVGIRSTSTDPKHFYQVMELPMNVSDKRDWSVYVNHIVLFLKDLLCHETYLFYFLFF